MATPTHIIISRLPNSDEPTALENFTKTHVTATSNVLAAIGDEAVRSVYRDLCQQVESSGGKGIDYLQQYLVTIDGKPVKVWAIDDGVSVCIMLPEDY